ncbi:MAG: hypothetical protein ED557_03935 [Balneola sp.]|nr:MAG: hypothetical protein ED557_03935 [Balneola sp.]
MHKLRVLFFWGAFFVLLCSGSLLAQEIKPNTRVSVSLIGHMVIQPGIQVGSEFFLDDPILENPDRQKTRYISVEPKLGYFTRYNLTKNFLAQTEVGILTIKEKRRVNYKTSVSLGYLLESKTTSFSVNLGTGSKSNEETETNHFFLPSINQEIIGSLGGNNFWFNKYSLGKRFGTSTNSMTFFVELGIKFSI